MDKKVKKVFISLPMKGKSKENILATIEKVKQILISEYPDFEISIIDSFDSSMHTKENQDNDFVAIELLSKSLSKMSNADIVYFVKGWNEARGCQIENEVARRYLEPNGIKIIEEGYEEINLELTDAEIEKLNANAYQMGVSTNKYLTIILQTALANGDFERFAKELTEKRE